MILIQKLLIFYRKKIKHDIDISTKGNGFAAVTAIGNLYDEVTPVFDRRRRGSGEVISIINMLD